MDPQRLTKTCAGVDQGMQDHTRAANTLQMQCVTALMDLLDSWKHTTRCMIVHAVHADHADYLSSLLSLKLEVKIESLFGVDAKDSDVGIKFSGT
jgi:hypothetical protein